MKKKADDICTNCANDGCWCCLECQKTGSHFVDKRKLPKKKKGVAKDGKVD